MTNQTVYKQADLLMPCTKGLLNTTLNRPCALTTQHPYAHIGDSTRVSNNASVLTTAYLRVNSC